MKLRVKCGAGLALLAALGVSACAPMPVAPGGIPGAAPGAPAPFPPGAPAAPPPAAPPRNIYSLLLPTPEQKQACRSKICNSPIGQLLNSSLGPAGALTGGLVGPFCPEVTPELLGMDPEGALGAASKIKADEAAAKQRAAAVRYLGTVDCGYWPEAQMALINALRADRNECVRLEAAIALGRGCCCNRATIKALVLTVEGGNEDMNPRETSDRVKAAAHAALEHCLASYAEVEKVPPAAEPGGPEPRLRPVPEPPPAQVSARAGDEKPPVTPAAYYRQAQRLSDRQVAQQARHALDKSFAVGYPTGDRSVLGILKESLGGAEPAGPPSEPAPAPAPVVPGLPVYPPSPTHGPAPIVAKILWKLTPRKMALEMGEEGDRANLLDLLRRAKWSHQACDPAPEETPPQADPPKDAPAPAVGESPGPSRFLDALRSSGARRPPWKAPVPPAGKPEEFRCPEVIILPEKAPAASGDVPGPREAGRPR